MISKKVRNTIAHILFWVVVFLLPFLRTRVELTNMNFPPGMSKNSTIPPPPILVLTNHRLLLVSVINTCMLAGVFYSNLFFSSRFLYSKKVINYLLSLVLIIAVFTILTNFLLQNLVMGPNSIRSGISFFHLLPIFIVLILSTSFSLFTASLKKEKMFHERETEKLKFELKFLRSQINPHFLFNVLNSLVSLARKKSEILEPTIIKLSEIMHYMIYDSNDDFIPVSNEVAYLKNYIELQRLRFGNVLIIKQHFEESNTKSQKIAPMLLIPLIENAFKHGTGFIGEQFIDIDFSVTDRELCLKVSNGYEISFHRPEPTSGVGLANLRRRLELIYPNQHEFNYSNFNNIYFTELTIKCA